MLIVISNPDFTDQEASLINQLFDAGMERFHMRKPGHRSSRIRELLSKINPVHYEKIALHQHHKLAKEFGINRLHFPEKVRRMKSFTDFRDIKESGNILTTSVHRLKKYKSLSLDFDYCFLGPVFNSISKEGYASARKDDFTLAGSKTPVKLIALGGIKESSMREAYDMGFDGVAVLGSIWKDPQHAIENFKKLNELCLQIAP